jgi:hypothetical protein
MKPLQASLHASTGYRSVPDAERATALADTDSRSPSKISKDVRKKTMYSFSIDSRLEIATTSAIADDRHADTLTSDQDRFHRGWERWVASNLMRGVTPAAIVRKMFTNGFSAEFAAREIDRTLTSPIYEAAFTTAERAKKLGYLLEILGELRSIAPPPIDRVTHIEPTAFLRTYVAQNRPVLIEGLANAWPARRWTLSHLSEVIGDTEVEVASGRESDPRYEDNFRAHVRRTTFAHFIDQVREGGPGNDLYLVSKNRLLRQTIARPLLEDIPRRIDLLGSTSSHTDAGIWIGPAGTVTPLHHDACNILFVQILGRKRVQLVAPAYITRIYNDRNCFTDFDPEQPDFARFPQMCGVPIEVIDLDAGDALLLPVGWWHHVRALDASVSLSFPQFTLKRSAHVWKWRKEVRNA